MCVAALASDVSRGTCVIAECVQAVPRKEEAVEGSHDAAGGRCMYREKGIARERGSVLRRERNRIYIRMCQHREVGEAI